MGVKDDSNDATYTTHVYGLTGILVGFVQRMRICVAEHPKMTPGQGL